MIEPIQNVPHSDSEGRGATLPSSEDIIEQSEQQNIENNIEMTKPIEISTHQHVDSETSLDDLIEKGLGNFGRTQLLQSLLVSLAMFFDAQQSFISVYTDSHPPWHCTSTNHTQYCGPDKSDYDLCRLPRSAWDWNGPSSMTIISQWGLECVNPFITGLPQSSFFMGCFVAGFLIATLADSSLGRKNMLFLSCFTMSIASLIIVFSNNIWVYSALKFVIGFCRSSVGTSSLVLLTERVRKEWRFRVGVLEYIWYTLGFLSLPAIAYINRESPWKSLYIWAAVPGICYSVFAYVFVTESPRWLLMQGREKEAMALLRASGATLSSTQLTELAQQRTASSTNSSAYSSIRQLFVKRWALKRLLAVLLLGFGIGMVYYGVPLNVGSLGFNMYLSVLFYALIETPAFIATYLLHNRRRKPSLFAFSVASGFCCLICGVIGNKKLHIVKLVLAMVSFFNIATSFDIFLIYVVELFPTSVRNTTTSMARQAMVFGAIFSPFLISAGRKNDLFSYGIFGVIIIVSAASLLCLAETKGIALCDTMDQQEKKETINV